MANNEYWRDDAINNEYRQANKLCELARYFPAWDQGWTTIPGKWMPKTHVRAFDTARDHVHHIAVRHAGNRRWDRVWNLIGVCRYAHDFIHAYPLDGLAMCLWAKQCKGEWDSAEAFEKLGVHLVGYLYGKSCHFDFAEEIRRKVIDEQEAAA